MKNQQTNELTDDMKNLVFLHARSPAVEYAVVQRLGDEYCRIIEINQTVDGDGGLHIDLGKQLFLAWEKLLKPEQIKDPVTKKPTGKFTEIPANLVADLDAIRNDLATGVRKVQNTRLVKA